MIKRLEFVTRRPGLTEEEFADAWRDASVRLLDRIPPEVHPDRLALCTVWPGRRERRHDGMAMAYFADAATADAHDAALGGLIPSGRDEVLDISRTERTLVTERTVNGSDWLATRWTEGPGLRTMVLLGLLPKAPGLTRTEFAEYWWSTHRPLADAMMPPAHLSIAYNHNHVAEGDPSRWDGIGEFHEESLDVVRARTAWTTTDEAIPLIEDEAVFLDRDGRDVMICDFEVIVGDSQGSPA